MIAKTMLENDSLPSAFRHLAVDQPSDREGDAAEDQQRAEGLEDKAD